MRFRRVISWALAFLALVAMTATAATTATAAPLPTTASTQTSVAATTATTGLCKVSAHPTATPRPFTQQDANVFLFYGRVYSQTDLVSFKVVNQAQIFSKTGNFVDTLNYERFYTKTLNGNRVLGLHRCSGDTLLNLHVDYTDSKGKIRSVRWNGRGTIPVTRAFVVSTTADVQQLVLGRLSYVSAGFFNRNVPRQTMIFD